MRIVLDAMGGDNAPGEIIQGAYLASSERDDLEIILTGDKTVVDSLLKTRYPALKATVIHAPETIAMAESPAVSIRRKRQSSIVVGLDMLKRKEADAFVSFGNTGAVVCGSILGLRLIKGVERPGIAVIFPTLSGSTLMIDAGANIDAKPRHLLQYALMSEVYSRELLDKENPSVGLLNIGEEEGKGLDFLKETANLLKSNVHNFKGNVEPNDMFSGECDCIVADGHTGNITLKTAEAVISTMKHLFLSQVKKDVFAMAGLFLMQRSLEKVRQSMDYAEYGGALLLGVDGVVIIGHGRSRARAVKNAIRVACREVESDVTKEIEERING